MSLKEELQTLVGANGVVTAAWESWEARDEVKLQVRLTRQLLGSPLYWADVTMTFLQRSGDFRPLTADVHCVYEEDGHQNMTLFAVLKREKQDMDRGFGRFAVPKPPPCRHAVGCDCGHDDLCCPAHWTPK